MSEGAAEVREERCCLRGDWELGRDPEGREPEGRLRDSRVREGLRVRVGCAEGSALGR